MADTVRQAVRLIAALMWWGFAVAQLAWAGPGWTEYELRDARFAVPDDWQVTSRIRDTEFVIDSPGGVLSLLAFWWRPDEPLLSFDDVVGHRQIEVAGQTALLIRLKHHNELTLQLAFETPRDNGEQFLMSLTTYTLGFEELEQRFAELMAQIAFPGEAAPPPADTPSKPPEPPQATDGVALVADAAGGFSFRLPEGWQHFGSDLPGARQVLITDPERSVLALIIAPHATGTAGLETVRKFETLLMNDTLVPRSIEADGEARIAGAPARWVEVIARVYGIGGVRPGFDTGTARVYVVEGDRPMLLAHVAGAKTTKVARAALEGLFGTLTTGVSTTPPAATRPATGLKPWLAVLNPDLGGDCRLLDLGSWQHPVRAELDRQADVTLQWAALCRGDSYAVFGAEFGQNPRADTDGYFYPLYVTTFLANERRDFAFVDTGGDLLITLTFQDPDQLRFAYRDLVVAPMPNVERVPAIKATKATPPDPEPAAKTEEEPETEPAADPEATAQVLFDGEMSDAWRPLSVAGGDFDRFARIEDGVLRVDVPAGNGWGKTGIWSARPDIVFDGPEDSKHLSFEFDPEGTGGKIVISLGQLDHPEEWSAHRFRLAWWRMPEDETGHLRLYDRTRELLTVEVPPEAPETVDLRVDGRGAVSVSLNGVQVAQTSLPAWNRQDGYRIYALAHAPQGDASTRMALRRITVDTGDGFIALAPYRGANTGTTTLFDGTLGHLWVPHSAVGGDFATQAVLDAQGLTVTVPEGHHWAHTGILSPEPVIWLDDFHDGAETAVSFDIDPGATDGFGLTLTQIGPGGIYSNTPAHPSVTFLWAPGVAELHLNPHRQDAFDRLEAADRAPDTVTFRLRPGEITLEVEGMEPLTRAWGVPADGAGLRIFAHSRAPEAGAPVRFGLREIRLDQHPAAKPPAPQPAEGVDPLPVETVFDGRESDAWEPIGVAGGDFTAFARYENGALRIDVPEGNWWGKTGLLSVDPLVRLDRRVWTTPTRIELQLDTDRPQNLNFALSTKRLADMWHDHKAWISLHHEADGNRWSLSMRSSPYSSWSRAIDGEWMDAHWDGRVWIDLGADWGAVEIPGGPRIRGPMPVGNGSRLFAAAQSHSPADGAAAQLDLKKISVGLVTPDGMSRADRWGLLDDDAFDAGAFVEDLMDAL